METQPPGATAARVAMFLCALRAAGTSLRPFRPVIALAAVVACAVLAPASACMEPPRGAVFPFVVAKEGGFDLYFLDDVADFAGEDMPEGPFQPERRVLYMVRLDAQGRCQGAPAKQDHFASTVDDTEAFYGREVPVIGLGMGLLQNDGLEWLLLKTEPRVTGISLYRLPWLWRREVAAPWGRFGVLAWEEGTEAPLSVNLGETSLPERWRPVGFHADRDMLLILGTRDVRGPDGRAVTGLSCLALRRPTRASAETQGVVDLAHEVPVLLPVAPCVRKRDGRYLVVFAVLSRIGTDGGRLLPSRVDVMIMDWRPGATPPKWSILVAGVQANTALSFDLVEETLLLAYHEGSPMGRPPGQIVVTVFDLAQVPWSGQPPRAGAEPDAAVEGATVGAKGKPGDVIRAPVQ